MEYRPTAFFRRLRFVARTVELDGFRAAIVQFSQAGYNYARKRVTGSALNDTPQDAPSQNDAAPPQIHPFDLQHGINTSGNVAANNLSSVSLSSSLFSNSYAPVLPSVLLPALSALPIQYEDFNFVDLGCGKGRALFLAAQFPFRYLIGVDMAGELCDIAKANVATNPDWIARITIANEDATKVVFPDGPLLIYMYNPFLAPVLRQVLKSLERQLRTSPRPTYIVYQNSPGYPDVMNSFPFLREISHTDYTFSPEDAAHDAWNRTHEPVTVYSADLSFKK